MTDPTDLTDTTSVDELLSDTADLPTETEGTGLGESDSTEVNTDEDVVPVQDPAAVPELDPAALTNNASSDEDPTLLHLDPTVDPDATPLPGAPANEFEALKETLLNTTSEVKIDEVTVNVDLIENEEETGEIFHEHTNYDTMVLNHEGGPYLTDVDNTRNAVLAEYRMELSKEATRAADEEPNVTVENSDVTLETPAS